MRIPFRFRGTVLSTMALVIALLAVAGVTYAIVNQQKFVRPLQVRVNEQNAMLTRMTGLMNPHATNALSPAYADANGDLIADTPADPEKQLDPPTLRFSYLAVDDPDQFKGAFDGLMTAISKATGKKVQYVEYDDPKLETAALRDGNLDVAGFATGAVPIAVCAAGFVPVAQMADAHNVAGYQMQIIVPAGSPLQKLTDLRGHELTLTEPTSNSGYKAPLVLLREAGLMPPNDYLLRYSQSHIASIKGIKAKTYEAAAIADDVLKREVAAGDLTTSDYHSIYTSPNSFPGAALGYSSRLKPELAQKIADAILGYDWKGTPPQQKFAAEGKTHFVPVDYKRDWEYVRRIDANIGFTYSLNDKGPAPATQPGN